MSDRFSDSEAAREALSAVADGEAVSQDVARACAAWREQPDARAAWHTYQLIGDVMRSEDLARASDGNAFLGKFRERLAQEPVVLAPSAAQAQRLPHVRVTVAQPQPAPTLRRRTWAGPMAVAAGFVLVVGALVSSQILPSGTAGGEDARLAQAQPGGWQGGASTVASLGPGSGATLAAAPDGEAGNTPASHAGSFSRPGEVVMVRDPQLDQALAMQRVAQSSEGSFAGQGTLMRQVVFDGR